MIYPGDYIVIIGQGTVLYRIVRQLGGMAVPLGNTIRWRETHFEVETVDCFDSHMQLREEWGFVLIENVGNSIGLLRQYE